MLTQGSGLPYTLLLEIKLIRNPGISLYHTLSQNTKPLLERTKTAFWTFYCNKGFIPHHFKTGLYKCFAFLKTFKLEARLLCAELRGCPQKSAASALQVASL